MDLQKGFTISYIIQMLIQILLHSCNNIEYLQKHSYTNRVIIIIQWSDWFSFVPL